MNQPEPFVADSVGIAAAISLRSTRKTIKRYFLSSDAPPVRALRGSKLDPYKPVITELLQQDSTTSAVAIGQHLRALGYSGGKSILCEHLRQVRTIPSQPPLHGSRQEVFDWMHAVLRGSLSRGDLVKELGHVAELDALLTTVWEGRLSQRNKAMLVLTR